MPRERKFMKLEDGEEEELPVSMSEELLKIWKNLIVSDDLRTQSILSGINYLSDGWAFTIIRLNDLLSKCSETDLIEGGGGIWNIRRKILDTSKLTDEEKEELKELIGILDIFRQLCAHTPQIHKIAYMVLGKTALPKTSINIVSQQGASRRPLFMTHTSIMPRSRGGFEFEEGEE